VLTAGLKCGCVLAPFEGVARPPPSKPLWRNWCESHRGEIAGPPRRAISAHRRGNVQPPSWRVSSVRIAAAIAPACGPMGLLSWPRATPQPRHPATQEVTPPVAYRTDMHPENRGDFRGVPPLQRQQDRPRPIRFAAVLRFRQVTQHGLFRTIRRELRSPWHACLHSPHPRQTIHSIAHSQAVCHENGLLSAFGHAASALGSRVT